KGQDIDTLLNKWETRLKKQNLISCRIKQIKKITFLKNEISLKGQFYYKYPHFFRIEIKGDENYDIYCDGNKVHVIDHDLKENEVYDFEELYSQNRLNKLLHPVIGQTQEEIKNNYEITFNENDEVYELTPKTLSSRSYEKIVFKVDSMDRIKWMKVLYKNSDWTETEFSNWKELDKVSDYFFKYLK
ncbi:MAG: LolA family protein, partial [Acidobacteriota bacterium]